MKKFVFLLILSACAIFSKEAMAQDGEKVFDKDSRVINLGIGLGTVLYGSGYSGTIPPVSVSYEQGIADGRFGVGGYLGHTGAKWGSGSDYWKFSYTVIGARGAYHFYTTDKLDTYGGVILGYNIVNHKWHGTDGEDKYFKANSGGVVFSPFVGGRYYFSPNIGAFAELGYGIAWLNLGVAFKF